MTAYPTSRTALAAFTLLLSAATVVSAAEQSPIDITSAHTTFSFLPALNFSYGTTSLDVQDTGSPGDEATIKAFVPNGAASLTLGGDSYGLLQFHFHTESEHLINGVGSAMEMHMVNRDAGGHLLVVGRLIDIGAKNVALDAIFAHLPTAGSPLSISSFNLGDLLPSTLTSYRYPGSLTTSPFTEGVSWVVLSEHLEMSLEQVDAFRTIFPTGDSREVQLLDGRSIQTDVVGFAAVPEPAEYAAVAGLALVAFGAWRRTRR
jgi:carbonic anhydrase